MVDQLDDMLVVDLVQDVQLLLGQLDYLLWRHVPLSLLSKQRDPLNRVLLPCLFVLVQSHLPKCAFSQLSFHCEIAQGQR